MIKIGDKIKITTVSSTDQSSPTYELKRSPSTYHFGSTLELHPYPSKAYTVCGGDSVSGFVLVDSMNHDIPIGFCILIINEEPYIRITQVGHQPERVKLEVVGFDSNPPRDKFPIGSQVFVATIL
jgi:hypothetical protein